MNRRTFTCGLGASVCFTPTLARSQSLPSLAELGRLKGIDIGTAFEPAKSTVTDCEVDLVLRHCSVLTPEFSLKQKTNHEEGFDRALRLRAFADAHSLGIHGHTLYFATKDPKGKRGEKETLLEKQRRFSERFRKVKEAVPNAISWDVLNEVVDDVAPNSDGTPRIVDPTLEQPTDRLQFLKFCLDEARATFGKGVQLALNDDNLFADAYRSKRRNLLATVRTLLDLGAPLDAVGIQSHLTSKEPPRFDRVENFIEELARLGLSVFVSELDFKNHALLGSEEEKDHKHADFIFRYLSSVLAKPNVKRLVFWGLSDRGHWLSGAGEEAGCSSTCTRPTLFDEDYSAKPAYHAVVRALQSIERTP